ncbi:MAG: LD-carboxypeptidase [Gammaproteobacteria bacterium]
MRFINLILILNFALFTLVSQAADALLKPQSLKPGDTVALISSGFRVSEAMDVEYATERLKALGLKVIYGKAILEQTGYFAGTDEARAQEINEMFANPKVKAIFELRGGWGSARLLDKLDYNLIKQHPKIIIGFSDITALLLAINHQTHLITFHGPMGSMPWPKMTTEYLKKVLFDGEQVTFTNPQFTSAELANHSNDIIQTEDRIQVINPGIARGRIIGGNLTVLTSLIGSRYLPKNWQGKILFIEEVDEDVYKIDRMMEQLKLAGILDQISGFVFGLCTQCSAKTPYGSYRLQEVLKQYIQPLHIPAWYGALIGHHPKMFTIPEGALVEINAEQGSIHMLESAVKG